MSSAKSIGRGLVAGLASVGLVFGGWYVGQNAGRAAVTVPTGGVAPAPAEVAKVEPKPEPKPEPKTEAVEPKPAPVEPKPAPKLEPKPVAPVEPKPVAAAPKPDEAKPAAGPSDHTMFGGTPGRNMINTVDKNIKLLGKPEGEGDAQTWPTMKWKADLGSRAYGGPTVSGGKVFIGTNNERPRNKRDQKATPEGETQPVDKGVLMCFDEKTGAFLWQAIHDKLDSGPVNDWPREGICSCPTVEGDKVYYISNRCTVVCADVNGMANGNQGIQTEKYKDKTDVDILWEYDLMKQQDVFPHNMSAGCPLIVGDILYTVTANGVDEGHVNLPSVAAPSFIALNKTTGEPVWKTAAPGKNIMHGQWSNPVYAEIGGVKQVIFPGGDGWLYAYEPLKGGLIWKFDCNPKDAKYELGGQGTRNDFIGTPVLWDNKIIIGVGQDPEHFTGIGHLWCIDPAKATKTNADISPRDKAFDPKDPKNADSGLVWHYGGADTRKFVPRDFLFGRTMSSACVVDGVLYIAELQGFLHCLDAKTGKKYWQFDTKAAIWGSAYYADGKVYLATEGSDMFVFKHDKAPKTINELDNPDVPTNKEFRIAQLSKRKAVETLYLLEKVEFDAAIRSTPVVANGVLYVMTESRLYAFGPK